MNKTAEPIPFNDLRQAYAAHKQPIDAAVQCVLESGWYILGNEASAFEAEYAGWCESAEPLTCVGVNSGTDALTLALRALHVGPGDEVITVSHTAVATVAAIQLSGATPVLVDIDAATYTMNPQSARAALTPRTAALLPVHLYGQSADLEPLAALAAEHNLALIEDCAQAHGATCHGVRVGTSCDAACYSFYPTKNLAALGDGGAVVTRRPEVAERVRLLREYGWSPEARYVSQIAGVNSRLDEVQAAILRARLPTLHAENERRRTLAHLYGELLPQEVVKPAVRDGCEHVYHLYVVRAPSPAVRDGLRAALAAQGIGTAIHYPVPIHRQPAYREGGVVVHDLRVTDEVASTILSLPMHPWLSDAQVERICAAVRAFFVRVA